MATGKGAGADDLTLYAQLLANPQSFHLFQALRIIEAQHRDRPRLGQSRRAAQDPVRLGQEAELAFPTSTIADFKKGDDGQMHLTNRTFGLFGPQGPLPLHLTEYARNRRRNERDGTLIAFANLFTHRLMGLFYRAWAAGQPAPSFDRPEQDAFERKVAALSGYNGFNLIAADFKRGECFWASNLSAHPQRLERGTYAVSNALLDTAWPKTNTLKVRLRDALSLADSVDSLATALFSALADRRIADDADLPSTGVPIELERELSAVFIRAPERQYGTRCSTLVISERVGRGLVTRVLERSYTATGAVSLLRQSTLKGWPPRYGDDAETSPVEQSVVSDAPRTRVRSLLKPSTVPPRRSTTR